MPHSDTAVTSDALKELSDKATKGVWHFNRHDAGASGGDYHGDLTSLLRTDASGVGVIRTIAVFLKYAEPEERAANADFVVALVNAFRDGKLIEAPLTPKL